MLKVIDKWKSLISKLTNVIVGRSAVELSNNCSLDECNLGNLIADSYVFYVRNNYYSTIYMSVKIIIIFFIDSVIKEFRVFKNSIYNEFVL